MFAERKQGSPLALSDLSVLAEKYRDVYAEAAPWAHVVLQDFFDPSLVAEAEVQELPRTLELEVQKGQNGLKAESAEVGGEAATEILNSLLTPEFVAFLENLTGIASLRADPSHTYAGLHVSPPGAFQGVHRDFRRHPITRQYHRVNVLVYMNTDWKLEYGGELELWSSDMLTCSQRIRPLAGKMVIFETTATSYHGIPDPVRCPPGRARLSLASYYYTEYPGPHDRRNTKIFLPRRPQDPWRIDVEKFKCVVKRVGRDVRESFTARSQRGNAGRGVAVMNVFSIPLPRVSRSEHTAWTIGRGSFVG